MLKKLFFKSDTPRWLIFLIDLTIVVFSILLAYMLRFNFRIPDSEIILLKYSFPTILLIKIFAFYFGKTYSGIIKYTSTEDAKRIIAVNVIAAIVIGFSNIISFQVLGVFIIPFSIVILEFLVTCFILVSLRAFIKIAYDEFKNPLSKKSPVLIFGAGEAGMIAKRTIDRDAKSSFNVVGFVDDDVQKTKRKLENKPIFKSNSLAETLREKNISHLIVSTQNISKFRLQEIIKLCLEQRVQVLNVPSPSKWINGELSVKQLRQIRIEDLLGRTPIELSEAKIKTQLAEKVVLITGAAGSIGSEIVRQVIRFNPKKIILVDQAESDLYELEVELSVHKYFENLNIVIGDVTNLKRMEVVFKTFQPDIVYHAAAYKHVPMMENNPYEAIKTNVLGTKNIADLSVKYAVKTFVMVSTDKAVNPTNVMGASKRVAEIYTQSINQKHSTKFITTRFGNVLGSNGSVIPLFKKQIENGGPITVTHPEITRYFMTIPEACQLVLEAGTSGEGGEIFIFDMGKSVKIKDLASQMIKLSGLEEGKDIQVIFTGLRPGEKLYEELLNDKESTKPTHHPQIMIANVKQHNFDTIESVILDLIDQASDQNNEELVSKMKGLVPEYKSNNSIYEKLD